jgi:hypothetical protein
MALELVFETHCTSVDNEAGRATGWLPGQPSEPGRMPGPDEGGGPSGGHGPGGPGGPGSDPVRAPAGTGPDGYARQDAGPSVAALVNITVPLGTLHGGVVPGEAAGFGMLDAPDARDLVAAAARHPGTRWCVTGLHRDGTAAAHGCLPGRGRPPPGPDAPGPDPPSGTTPGRPHLRHHPHRIPRLSRLRGMARRRAAALRLPASCSWGGAGDDRTAGPGRGGP